MSRKKTEQEIINEKAQRLLEGVAIWCSFYRANPHRFAEEYLGIHLKLFQQIILFMMNISTTFMSIAARGQG